MDELFENEELEAGTTTKLVLTFQKANGNTMTLNYNYAKADVRDANVKALMQGIVANGAIFENVPAAIKSANVVTTTTKAIDLS